MMVLKTIKHILTLQLKNVNQARNLISSELQDYVLKAQTTLSALFTVFNRIHISSDAPNLMKIISSSVINDNEDDTNALKRKSQIDETFSEVVESDKTQNPQKKFCQKGNSEKN